MLCRHCQQRPVSRPRGLCHNCYYYKPGVRDQYPSRSKFAPSKPERTERLPARRAGDPAARCLWCMRWRCQRPLELCPECQKDYEGMAARMPA